ncbi:MAG: FAD-dependent monooxygenase [Promethearchaeota archaeon]
MNQKTGNIGTREKPYDVLISGAGPAGLTAGIICGRNHLKTLICEKGQKPGPFPRGETLHAAKIFTEVLGADVLNMIGKHFTAARRLYSPSTTNYFDVIRNSPSIIYNWDDFIDLLVNRLNETETELLCNAEIESPIIENRICIGIKLTDGKSIYARTILACDGYNSNLGKVLNVPYEKINYPTVKCLISNFHGKYKGFQYFPLVPGQLEYSPRFPPSILFIFPRGKDECEIGLMILKNEAKKLHKYCDIPSDDEIMDVWHKLCKSYPVFSENIQGVKIDFEQISGIATGQVYTHPMPRMGLIFVGGAMGFIEASGGSGITSSMRMGKFAADFLATHQIKKWTPKLANSYIRTLKRTSFWKHILKNAKKTRIGRNFVFVKLRTKERIEEAWPLIKHFF